MTSRPRDDREGALDALSQLGAWRADNRKEWLDVGMALQSVGDDLFEAWDLWSQQSEKYGQKACRSCWKGFKSDGGIGLGTLIQMAQEEKTHLDLRQLRCGEILNLTHQRKTMDIYSLMYIMAIRLVELETRIYGMTQITIVLKFVEENGIV